MAAIIGSPWTREDLETVARMRLEGKSWPEIGQVMGLKGATAERRWARASEDLKLGLHPTIEGVTAGESSIDAEEVWQRAVAAWRKTDALRQRKSDQRVTFERGPICIVGLADMHLGSSGVDYPRLDQEVDIVAETPGMYAMTLGDEVDNFIVKALSQVRLHAAFSIPEEAALADRILAKLAPKLVASVSGNHNEWTRLAAGVDAFRHSVAAARPDVLYDTDDTRFTLSVGGFESVHRARHKWRGYSIYNPTHGIEATWQRDQARRFRVGWGAHTHVSGLARPFNAGGETGYAIQLGAYKREDAFARRIGFPEPNTSTAIALMIHPEGWMAAYENLEHAADVLRKYWPAEV